MGLYNQFVKDRNAEEKYEKAKAYVAEHPEAKMPPAPVMKSRDRIEDFQKIPELLKDLETHLNDVKEPIQTFKSVTELASAVRAAMEKDIKVDEKAQKNYKIFREAMADGLKVVYQDNDWIIGVPETYEASSHFKKPVTDWCTAYPEKYEEYMSVYGGKYYIHLNRHTGDLYQLYAESEQFKDASDNEIDRQTFIAQNPHLKRFYDKIIVTRPPSTWFLCSEKPSTNFVRKAIRLYTSAVDIAFIVLYINANKNDYKNVIDSSDFANLLLWFKYYGADERYDAGNYIIRIVQMVYFFDDTIEAPKLCDDYLRGQLIFKDRNVEDINSYTVANKVITSLLLKNYNEHELDATNITDMLEGKSDTYAINLINAGHDKPKALEKSKRVQNYLLNEFGDGLGATACYEESILRGAETAFATDFKRAFDTKYIVKESLEFGSDGLKYKIPSNDYLEFVASTINIDYPARIATEDLVEFLYGHHELTNIFSVPYGGWSGFDEEIWVDACKNSTSS